MTKLYHGPEGQGWQIPGQQDRKAARVDVPSSPAELAAWLNERHVWATPREIDREQIGRTGEYPDLTMEELESLGDGDPAPAPCNTADAGELRSRCPECKSRLIVSAAGADKAAISRDLDKIAEWAIAAPSWALERLAEMLASEARELERHAEQGKGRAN